MKKVISFFLTASLLLTGCASQAAAEATLPEAAQTLPVTEAEYVSQFPKETRIFLSDEGINVEGNQEAVTTSHDIVYYEDRDTYDSGNPYGEGTDADKHTADEAASHTVVNITRPGAYRISGKLSAGQLRVDLGEEAYEDPDAVVELILDNVDITCTVAPAILFQNVYECDGDWSVDTAKADVDTSAAGANLILEGRNTVRGAYVAKIYKDAEGEKKLWKQDGAIYSYMSMNVYGPGALELDAENEGLDTELHLTLHSGNVVICSGNDGINTNADGVSVTTINGGNLTIFAGLGNEGDGIDSNGYLVINGGRIFAAANPAADAGLDSDLGSFIHGGTVIATGSAMDWAESDSEQVTMNLQFAAQQAAGSKITITREDGTEIFSFQDDGSHARPFTGVILSHPYFVQGETYHLLVDGIQQAYTGSDLGWGSPRPGGMQEPPEIPGGGFPGQPPEVPQGFEGEIPENIQPGQRPEPPRGEGSFASGQRDGSRGPQSQEGEAMPSPDHSGNQPPEPPEGAAVPQLGGEGNSTGFRMTDKVNAFTGISTAEETKP